MIGHAPVIGGSGGIGLLWQPSGAHVTSMSRRDDGLDVTDETSIREAFARKTL